MRSDPGSKAVEERIENVGDGAITAVFRVGVVQRMMLWRLQDLEVMEEGN